MPVTAPAPRPYDYPEDVYQAWLRREVSIGGSEVGAILGVSEWATPADIFDAKLGLRPPPTPNQDMARGTALEATVAQIYAEQTGRTVRSVPPRRRMRTHPYLHSSPDRMIRPCFDPSVPEIELAPAPGPGVLEVKCPRSRGAARVRVEGIAPTYYAQLQHYLNARGCAWGSFAVFDADAWELYWFDVLRDQPFIDRMVAELERFWIEHLVPRQRPGGRREPVVTPTRIGADSVWCDDPAFLAAVGNLRAATAEHTLAERRYEEARTRLRELIGENEAVVGPGVRISNRAQTRTDWDMAELHRDHPEIDLAPYRRQTATRPVLRVTFNGNGR